MTIGLTALVERYLTERRTLGFQLRSSAYSLRSLAEHVRLTRHRGGAKGPVHPLNLASGRDVVVDHQPSTTVAHMTVRSSGR